MSAASDLGTLARNEERAREQAAACTDIFARMAHLSRAAGVRQNDQGIEFVIKVETSGQCLLWRGRRGRPRL